LHEQAVVQCAAYREIVASQRAAAELM
jgi:hypothetical protein